jgi:Tat protein translocase TatB subunit
MFNIGAGEFLVIALIALIVLGPQKLPDAARQAGKWANELRKMAAGFEAEVQHAFEEHGGSDAAKAVTTLSSITKGPLGPVRTGLNAAVASVSAQASTAAPPEPARRAGTKKTTKKTTKRAPAKKAPAKKAAPSKQAAPAKKAPAKKAPSRKAAPAKRKAAPAKKAPAKKAAARRS